MRVTEEESESARVRSASAALRGTRGHRTLGNEVMTECSVAGMELPTGLPPDNPVMRSLVRRRRKEKKREKKKRRRRRRRKGNRRRNEEERKEQEENETEKKETRKEEKKRRQGRAGGAGRGRCGGGSAKDHSPLSPN